MKILLGIEGGAGKNIAATGAVREAAGENQVDIITAWPQIWQGNPHVNKVYDWNRQEYLFERLADYDDIIFNDPYRQSQFLLGEVDLTGMYNYMLNGNAQPAAPELFLNKVEHLHVENLLKGFDKPILAVQTNGGTSPGYSWTRDLPLEEAVEVLNEFTNDYQIVHLRADGQLEIEGAAHTADLDIRQSMLVLKYAQKRLLIDSVYQHAAAAMGLDSVVLWAMTEPEKFGYEMHTNIKCNEPQLKNTFRLEMLFSGLDESVDRCPFAEGQKIFDTKKIIDALKQK